MREKEIEIMKYICKEKYEINDILVGSKGDLLEITDVIPKENEDTEDVAGYIDIKNLTTNEIYEATWIDVDNAIRTQLDSKMEEETLRSIRQCIITDYLYNELGKTELLEEWAKKGGVK